MKSIAFNVQIQADFHDRGMGKKATAMRLCRDINLILMKYDGMTGGAQILQVPKNIKVSKTSND